MVFQELHTCRYAVALHESEDNGVSAAVFRPGSELGMDLVCVTTWTQSGTPVLIQPQDGHKSEIKTDITGRTSKLGNRIQGAVFSPSGREIAMVNDKGHLYQISNLDSTPIDIRRVATSKELIAKSDAFSMAFMRLPDEEYMVLAWVDPAKALGWIKKIPNRQGDASMPPTSAAVYIANPIKSKAEPAELESMQPPVELPTTRQAGNDDPGDWGG